MIETVVPALAIIVRADWLPEHGPDGWQPDAIIDPGGPNVAGYLDQFRRRGVGLQLAEDGGDAVRRQKG